MKEYIKGRASVRIVDMKNGSVKITYKHNQFEKSYFRPKDRYKPLVNLLRIRYLKDTKVLV
jgi:hypothetical protein